MKRLFATLALLSILSATNAQVIINEYSCSNWTLTTDNYGSYEDWIELYNPTTSPINIGNYYLSDKITQPTKWRFPASVIINPNSFLIVWASGRDEATGGNYHTNFRLTQTKFPSEYIVFSDASGTIVDQIQTQITQKHHSRGRNPNGGSNWSIYTTPTPGQPNNTASAHPRYAATPSFDQTAGFYSAPIAVTITTTEPNSSIYYTLDGKLPTTNSALYSGPLTIDSTHVLKAIVISSDPNILPSNIDFSTYFIYDQHTLPVVSIAGDDLDNLANGNGSLIPLGTIEYFNINRQRKTSGYGEFNRHGQDSWANDQRSLDFIMRDEFGYNYALEEPLFSNLTPRSEFQRVILRAAGDDNYPAAHHASNQGSAHLRDAYVQNLSKTGGLDLDVRIGTKAIVYLNGMYWGVYDLREPPDDHDYTDYYYNQGKYKLQYLETWGNTWAQYGGNQALIDWTNLRSYIMTHDMTVDSIWNYVTSQLDVASLADYVIVNSITVCSDWLNYNTGWWRGLDSTGTHKKWGYILWDEDAVFGFYVNYTGVPDKGALAPPCNVETGLLSDPEGHIDLLNKLRTNTGFNQYYLSRYLDIANTTFNCDNMLHTVDSLTAVIDPEMTRHANRWFGTYTEWRSNVQLLRDYIQQRCSTFVSLMDSCYNLTGPYPLTITETPIGTGAVKVNSLTLTDFPWSGYYLGGLPVRLTAIPDSINGFQFDQWLTSNDPVQPSSLLENVELNLTAGDSVLARFLQQPLSVSSAEEGFEAVASPSVFSDETHIAFYQKENSNVSITLYSELGSPVMHINGKNLSGKNEFTLNLSGKGLAPGLYLLNLTSDRHNETLRLVYTGQN